MKRFVNFLKWIFEDNSIPRKYISSTNLILYGDLIVLNKDRPDLFQRVVKGIHILNAQTKYQRYSAQLIDYLESGLYVDDHESTGLHINLKAIADILLHNDENAYRYLVTANNFNYVAPKHWPI